MSFYKLVTAAVTIYGITQVQSHRLLISSLENSVTVPGRTLLPQYAIFMQCLIKYLSFSGKYP